MEVNKKCGGCKKEKPKDSFVNIYGFKNTRGKYCKNCFLKNEQDHAISLLNGKDFCPYCGIKIIKYCDWGEDGKSTKNYLHLDHMDPLSLGGEDSDENTIYCCVKCNLRKSNKPYSEWLKQLEPVYREQALKVYIEKHGRKPEEFKIVDAAFRIEVKL